MTDRKKYVEKAMSRLEQLNAEINESEVEEDKRLAAAAEIKRRERKMLLRQKQAAVKECIRHLQHATETSWDTASVDFERSLGELQEMITKD